MISTSAAGRNLMAFSLATSSIIRIVESAGRACQAFEQREAPEKYRVRRFVMARTGLGLVVVFLLSLAVVAPAWGQLPEKRFITPDGKRPSGLFAPGVMVGKTLYIAGKGDYKPNEEFPAKVKNCLGEIEKTLKLAGLDRKS